MKAEVVIDEAINGQEVLDLMNKSDYDVVLMDIQMPLMDGYEATRRIRKDFPSPKNRTKVLALTASVIKSDIDKCMNAGMDDYVPKPFKPYQLFYAIAKAAGREIKFSKSETEVESPVSVENHYASNLNYLSGFAAGDKVKMKRYIDMFLESVEPFKKQISESIAIKDYANIATQLHAFKTRFVMMGMVEAKDLAYNLEMDCINKNDLATAETRCIQLMKFIDQAVKELAEFKV